MTKRRLVAQNLTVASAGSNKHVVRVPDGWVEKIQLSIGTTPTFGAGTYVANCALKNIIIRYGTVEIVNLDGVSVVDDKECAGMQLIREIEGQKAGVALADNIWVIRFIEPLLCNEAMPLEIDFTFETDERMGGDTSQTCDTGDIDIEVDYSERPGRRNPNVAIWTSGNWYDADTAKDFYHYFPVAPPGKKLRLIVFCVHDGGTRANDTYSHLQILYGGKILFDGSLAKLRNECQQKTGLALNTGCMFWSYREGLNVPAGSLLLKFSASSGGTAKYIEWIALWY